MKLLRRNTTEFEYLDHTGLETDVDENGDHTGEFHPVYADPVIMRGTISTPSGTTNQTFYGTEVRYTHVLVMDTPNPGITELGVICWKGEMYDIRSVKPSLNSVSIALRKQTKNNRPLDSESDGE